MGEFGHNLKFGHSRSGCRLPFESASIGDGYASSGPVTTYQLTPEEVAARYGPPVIRERFITRGILEYIIPQCESLDQAAKNLKISVTRLKQELARHEVAVPDDWKEDGAVENQTSQVLLANSDQPAVQKKSRREIALEKLSKDQYLELKAQGITDLKIMKQFGIANDIFYHLKKEWGAYGVKLQPTHLVRAPQLPGESQVEPAPENPSQGTPINVGALPESPIELADANQVINEQVEWASRANATHSEAMIRVMDRGGVDINRAALKMMPPLRYVRVGVSQGKLIISPAPDADAHRFAVTSKGKIGGHLLSSWLKAKGIAPGRYHLEKNEARGWWEAIAQ